MNFVKIEEFSRKCNYFMQNDNDFVENWDKMDIYH